MGMAFISLTPPAAPGGVSPLASHVVVGMLGNGLAFSADDGANWKVLVNITATNLTGAQVPLRSNNFLFTQFMIWRFSPVIFVFRK